MNKKLIILLIMLIFCMMGCGEKEDSAEVQGNANTNFKVQVDTLIDKEDSEIEGDHTGQVKKEIADEPVKYDCMDEIKTADPDSGLVQIDDMILQYGARFSEIASVVEQSECVYEADYNAHSVVPAGESIGLRFNKNGESYFMICVENCEKETVELSDCITYSIRALNNSMGNAYYANFGDDEMTYTTVKEAMKGYEPEKELFGSDSQGNKELGVMYTVPFQEDEMHIYFIFDGISNKLNKFEISIKNYDRAFWLW